MNVVTDHITNVASVAKKGNHSLDGNKLQVTVGTESDEEDSPGQHKATRGFPAAGANESSSDDEDSGGWSKGQSHQQKSTQLGSGSHTHNLPASVPDNARDVTRKQYISSAAAQVQHREHLPNEQLGTTGCVPDLPSRYSQHEVWRQAEISSCQSERKAGSFHEQIGRVNSTWIDSQQSHGKIKQMLEKTRQADNSQSSSTTPKNHSGSTVHENRSLGGARLKQEQSQPSSPQTRDTKLRLGEDIIDKITNESKLLKKLVTDMKYVNEKFNWKRPDHITVKCLTDNPPRDWEHQVAEQLTKFIYRHSLGKEHAAETPAIFQRCLAAKNPDSPGWKGGGSAKTLEALKSPTTCTQSATDRQIPA